MAAPRIPGVWNLWGNPIFRRYCRSRLRAGVLVPLIFIVVICAAFVFLTPYLYVLTKEGQQAWTEARAARWAVWAIFPLQALILMLLGTGSVASGLSQEHEDGMIDYQRLTPMPPSAKIMGYLFGLPVREYVLFLATMPFLIYAAWMGEVPAPTLLRFYLIFLTSAVLYHLAGLVTGTIFKRRRAGMMAQLLVVLLYVVIPNLSFVGFGAFRYFTVIPEFFKDLGPVLLEDAGRLTSSRMNLLMQQPGPVFFGFEFSVTSFSLLVQAGLIGGFCMVLWRKWRRSEHHVLGKPMAVAGMLWVALLLLGSSLPQVSTGQIFPFENVRKSLADQERQLLNEAKARWKGSEPLDINRLLTRSRALQSNQRTRRELERQFDRALPENKQLLAQAVLVAGFFGLLCFGSGLVFLSMITPTRDEFRNGLQRTWKLGRRFIPPWADEAGALPWAAFIAGIGVIAWLWFCRELFESHWIHSPLPAGLEIKLAAALVLPLLCYQALQEQFGRGRALLAAFVLWVVPVFAGILAVVVRRPDVAAFCLAFSALLLPLLATLEVSGLVSAPNLDKWPVDDGVHVALGIYALLLVGLLLLRARTVRHLRRAVFAKTDAGL